MTTLKQFDTYDYDFHLILALSEEKLLTAELSRYNNHCIIL